MKYILKNKNYGTYLNYLKRIRFKHYVVNKEEATIFNTTEVKRMLAKFKHPENWEMVRI